MQAKATSTEGGAAMTPEATDAAQQFGIQHHWVHSAVQSSRSE